MDWSNDGAIIGMKAKEKKFKNIIKKLLNKEELSSEEKAFLKKEKVLEEIQK